MKPRYTTVIFDADATLLDFDQCEQSALTEAFATKNIPLTDEMRNTYVHINKRLWSEFEQGFIEKQDILRSRFTELFAIYGITENGAAFNDIYQACLGHGYFQMDGAREICETLYPHCRLYIATNGNVRTQMSRIHGSGLESFFREIFVSEAAGEPKPSPVFFNYAFSRIPDLDKEKTIIIGDSLYSDIKGGHDAGIHTCWINPSGEAAFPGSVKPDYEIRHLSELKAIILGEETL